MEGLMYYRKQYNEDMTPLSRWTSPKAITAIVIGGATLTVIALTIANGGRGNLDSREGGKFVGNRHDAASISATDANAGQSQEASSDTVVRNGITVVSPQLRVPVVDLDAMKTGNGSDDGTAASKTSNGRKHSRDAKRSHNRRQTRGGDDRWPAYGLALR
jgi:hypothetical protein